LQFKFLAASTASVLVLKRTGVPPSLESVEHPVRVKEIVINAILERSFMNLKVQFKKVTLRIYSQFADYAISLVFFL